MKTEPIVAIQAMANYLYSVSPVQIVQDVYGEDIRPDYAREKIQAFLKMSFASFFGQMDGEHQHRLVDAAMQRYGKEAERV